MDQRTPPLKRLTLQELANMSNSRGDYDNGQVCLNGHAVTGSAVRYPEFTSRFCKHCGEPTTTECQKCQKPIRGDYTQGYSTRSWEPPRFCHECGAAYPWTERKSAALAEAIDELELPQGERDKLKESIPDVIQDTPKTQTAASRFGKAISKAGQWGGKLLSDVLTNVATEAALKISGLKP